MLIKSNIIKLTKCFILKSTAFYCVMEVTTSVNRPYVNKSCILDFSMRRIYTGSDCRRFRAGMDILKELLRIVREFSSSIINGEKQLSSEILMFFSINLLICLTFISLNLSL